MCGLWLPEPVATTASAVVPVFRFLRFLCCYTVLVGPLAFLPSLAAQTVPPPRRTLESKRYCHPSAGFCLRYPSTWTELGDVFNGNGVVIAPEQKGDRALWDAITVALVAPSSESSDSLNNAIERTTVAMREAGQNFETLQRRELTVAHAPAQMLKTRYRENSTGGDWIEELVFIQGPENEIYSVALKCSPEHLAKLEPVLKQVLASWTTSEPDSTPSPNSRP
jgi:hypothetical protein